jgi:hypothetical protein
MCPSKSPPIANRILAALPKKDYQELQRHLEEIPLVFEELLYRPNVLISDVYFPNSGVISLLAGINELQSVSFCGRASCSLAADDTRPHGS